MNGSREQSPSGLQAGSPPAATFSVRQLGRVFTLLLVMALAAVALPAMPAAAMPLPWQRPTADTRPAAVNRGLATLQEVSPPAAVQQLQSALAGRQPVVEILTPQDDATLPPGPWTLKLRVHDWPLVDGGDLGPGPHLVVQLDQEPPQIWTRSEGMMPELSPGSHLLSVYAAQPWGEARKNPGAVRQIRLHRTAANPLSLPAAGSPQLLAVSPSGSAGEEPLLLDWLLLDAPLQDVGGSGTQWRLRVTINDDAVLLDQQTPLWLQGWRPGRNALRLELLDARGEPLNPPFNSLVREVDVHRTEPPRRWGGPPLSGSELAILLGEAPAAPPTQPQPTEADAKASRPGVSTDAETGAASEPQAPQAEQAMAEPEPVTTPASPERAPDQEKPAAEPGAQGDARPTESAAPMAVEQPAADNTRSSSETPQTAQDFVAPEDPAANPTPAPATSLTAEEPRSDSGAPIHAPPRDTMTAASSTAPPQAPPPTASSAEQTSPPITEAAPSSDSRDAEPIRPSSQLTGRARDLVNDDGTLRQPEQRTALAGLRDWLKR